MIYTPVDGDEIKILPILKKDGTFTPIIEAKSLYLNQKQIYDYKDYLNKIIYKYRSISNIDLMGQRRINKRHFISIYHNSTIKYVSIGKTLFDIILKDYKFDPRNNLHLKINIEMKDINNMLVPSFEHSSIIEKDWIYPIDDINSQTDWRDYISNNHEYYLEDFIEERNIINNIGLLKTEFGDNVISEIIADERELKLNELLK